MAALKLLRTYFHLQPLHQSDRLQDGHRTQSEPIKATQEDLAWGLPTKTCFLSFPSETWNCSICDQGKILELFGAVGKCNMTHKDEANSIEGSWRAGEHQTLVRAWSPRIKPHLKPDLSQDSLVCQPIKCSLLQKPVSGGFSCLHKTSLAVGTSQDQGPPLQSLFLGGNKPVSETQIKGLASPLLSFNVSMPPVTIVL
jgi:hypothetical protein